MPRVKAEAYRQAVLRNNDARRDGRYRLLADANLDSAEAMALYAVLRQRRPWVDATLAVFERRADKPAEGCHPGDGPGDGGRLLEDEAADSASRAKAHAW